MRVDVRPASTGDVPVLVALMTAFYAESDFPLPAGPATRAFEALLADARLGGAWLAEVDGTAIGYVVLTLGFAMEYGGLRGCIDDLYVRQGARGRGAAAALLAAARDAAIGRGVRALQVEVGAENPIARRLYARAGYAESGHLLLTLPLAAPVHAA